LMLDHLGLSAAAEAIRQAVASVLAEGKIRTPDLGGSHTTSEMGQAVVAALQK